MKQITYFDDTTKILHNLDNCLNKDNVDVYVLKEYLKTLSMIIKTQNHILKGLTEIVEDDIQCVKTESGIMINMICFIRSRNKFAKIISIDEDGDDYVLELIDESKDRLNANKNNFNI